MRLGNPLARREEHRPGIAGPARIERPPKNLSRRIGAGDIAVINHPDLDRHTAEALIAAKVAGVVNVAHSISGRFPNLGPETLVSAGIPLVDGVGEEVLHRIKEGAALRLHGGSLFVAGREVGCGIEQEAASVADQMIEAKTGMSAQLESFSADSLEFLRKERMLILEGVGVPELRVPLNGEQVLVLEPGTGHLNELKRLKPYIREHRPVLIGVELGAEALFDAGYVPDVVVGDPEVISAAVLKRAREIVIPAQLDGHAPGMETIQELGVGAVTFPASGESGDLALLLADVHGAKLVVTVGMRATLCEFFDRDHSGTNPSRFLTRLRLGGKVVDGAAVVASRRRQGPVDILPLTSVIVVAALAAILVPGDSTAHLQLVARIGDSLLTYVGNFFG